MARKHGQLSRSRVAATAAMFNISNITYKLPTEAYKRDYPIDIISHKAPVIELWISNKHGKS